MNDYLRMHIQVTLTLLLIAGAIVLGVVVAHYNERDMVSHITHNLDVQKVHLRELALIVDRNGADETVAQIVLDCSERTEYETLLTDLATLNKSDLVKVQGLFESCGNFYNQRKALMVMKLSLVVEQYTELTQLLEGVQHTRAESYQLEKWIELVELEKNRSTTLHDQTAIQAHIITLLISGTSANNKEVQALVKEAQSMGELLTVNDHKIDTLRDSLQ
jgi:hypothetical protein